MRKKIVAGNWKMNNNLQEAIKLTSEIVNLLNETGSKSDIVILAPPFTFIASVADIIKNARNVKVAAQNCHSKENGAYTGEISVSMIKSVGAEYVIIGHSERRSYFNEHDDFLAEKLIIALRTGLTPIFCCGETLAEREKGNHHDIVKKQLEKGILHLSEADFSKIIIAYEPVWAIGTGVTATPEQAQEMHRLIRNFVSVKYGSGIAESTPILYGGSCNAKNAKELFLNPDVDGGLIGGASLIATDFVSIVNSF